MLQKAMEILSLYSHSRTDLGVVEASELLGSPKSTVSRRLAAMELAGLLDRDPQNGRYHLGIRLVTLGHLATEATPLQRMARPVLRRLTDETGETSDLVVLRDRQAVNIEAVESPRPMKHVGWAGRRIPLHATAAGKSLLAWRSEREIRELVRLPLERYTRNTIASLEALLEDLQGIPPRGYSLSLGEFEEDLVGVAAPVRNHVGGVVASVTIGAPSSRARDAAMPHLIQSVKEAGMALSRALGLPVEGADGGASRG